MTETFEEDLNKKINNKEVPMYFTQSGCSLTRKTYIETNWIFENYGNYHSDEEFKAEQVARKKEYELHQDIYSKTAKKLNKAELEIADLKSQLEQQPLPEVPEFVADEIYSRRYVSSSSGITPSDGLLLMEVFRDLNSSHDIIRNGISFKESKFYQWMKSSDNNKTFVEAVLNGYTVQKPKRFYLKNKITGMYLSSDGEEYYEQHKNHGCKLTQEEIDSMQTGSYEKIEVEE